MMLPPPAREHAGQRRLDRPQLRAHVEGEGELEVGVAGVEDAAVVDDAGAVEQDVDARQRREQRADRGAVEDVEAGDAERATPA